MSDITGSHANRRGMLAMTIGMGSFVTNDALVKHVSDSLPAGQLILVRGLIATLLMCLVAWLTGAFKSQAHHTLAARPWWRQLLHPKVLQRSMFDGLATLVYLSSLFHLPIGNATAINMAAPLIITLFAMLSLGERVSLGRWMGLIAGFGGVLLIVQPTGSAFNAWALLCLAGTVFHAARDLTTRSIPAGIPAVVIMLGTSVSVSCMAALLTALQGWQPMDLDHLLLLTAASVFLCGGYFLLILAMRSGDISLISSFRYTGLLYALLLGWLVWGDIPNTLASAGIVLLVGAAIYMLRSEQQRVRDQRALLDAAGTD